MNAYIELTRPTPRERREFLERKTQEHRGVWLKRAMIFFPNIVMREHITINDVLPYREDFDFLGSSVVLIGRSSMSKYLFTINKESQSATISLYEE